MTYLWQGPVSRMRYFVVKDFLFFLLLSSPESSDTHVYAPWIRFRVNKYLLGAPRCFRVGVPDADAVTHHLQHILVPPVQEGGSKSAQAN